MRAIPGHWLVALGLVGAMALGPPPAAARAAAAPTLSDAGVAPVAEPIAIELAMAERTGRQTRLNRSRKLQQVRKSSSDEASERLPPAVHRCQNPRRIWRQWERLRKAGGYQPWGGRRGNTACS